MSRTTCFLVLGISANISFFFFGIRSLPSWIEYPSSWNSPSPVVNRIALSVTLKHKFSTDALRCISLKFARSLFRSSFESQRLSTYTMSETSLKTVVAIVEQPPRLEDCPCTALLNCMTSWQPVPRKPTLLFLPRWIWLKKEFKSVAVMSG